MEGTPKRSKHVEAVNPLENKDILFSVFCFLAPKVLARAAAVSRAWRRASGTEGLWRRKCAEADIEQLPNETWRASFQLCQPQWRDWKLKQLEADITRLAALPLQRFAGSGSYVHFMACSPPLVAGDMGRFGTL
jgi:hypothetical protein